MVPASTRAEPAHQAPHSVSPIRWKFVGSETECASFDAFGLIRPYRSTDCAFVWSQLSFLPDLYPNSRQWLTRRLRDVEFGKARCTIVSIFGSVAGIAIEVDKGPKMAKLCTFYVPAKWRSRGVGSALLSHCSENWLRAGKEYVYVTADEKAHQLLKGVFDRGGFRTVASLPGRYAPDRTEVVLGWTRK
jgi:GNAT superfamily N-acetyltransferase